MIFWYDFLLLQEFHTPSREEWQIPADIRPKFIELGKLMRENTRVELLQEFCENLEKLGLQPAADDVVWHLRNISGENWSDAREKVSNFLKEPQADLRAFFNESLLRKRSALVVNIEALRNELKTLFDDEADFNMSLRIIDKMISRESNKLQVELHRQVEKIIRKDRKEPAEQGQTRKELEKAFTRACKKKAKAEIHLNFYNELRNKHLQPSREICQRDIADWLDDRESVETRYDSLKESANVDFTGFFITELETLITHLKHRCGELEKKFSSMFSDQALLQKKMKTIDKIVESDTVSVKYAKDKLLDTLQRKSGQPATVRKGDIGNIKTAVHDLLKSGDISISKKEKVERQLRKTLQEVLKIESRLNFYDQLLKQRLHQSAEDYELDLKYALGDRKYIYQRWDNYSRRPDSDPRKFILVELQDFLRDMKQNYQTLQQEYKSHFEDNAEFLLELNNIHDWAAKTSHDVQEAKDKKLQQLMSLKGSELGASEEITEVCMKLLHFQY